MELYIIIWVLLLLSSLTKYINRILFIFFSILLVLMSGFRAESVGTDTETYSLILGYISEGNAKYLEPGWYLLNKAVLLVNGDFNLVLLFAAFLTFLPLCYVVLRSSQNYCFSLFIFYSLYLYCNSLNLMRQGVAISFVLVFYYFLSLNKNKKAAFFLFLAFMFHYSSIIALLALFVKRISLNTVFVFLLCFSSLLIGSVIVKSSLLNIFLGPYAFYLESDSFGVRESFVIPFTLSFLLTCLFLFIFVTHKCTSDKCVFWQKIYFLSIIVNNLTFGLALGSRIIMYFTIVQIIYISIYVYQMQIRQKKIISILLVMYFALVFFKILLANGGDVYPYIISPSILSF